MDVKLKSLRHCAKTLAVMLACALCAAFAANAQQRVSGTVTDSSGEPLIGANVKVKGAAQGVNTDINGAYAINAKSGEILVFSYIGYLPQEVKVGTGTTIDVALKEDQHSLEEVVVVGYGLQKKVNLTGSVASVSSEDLVNKPVMNTSQALAGIVPGLSVITNSGAPGAGANIKIRGTGTFSNAGNGPLVLIDGMSGGLDDIDPNDIQSISFLKDAASASIYGNRAANGVILIETKKGQEGRTVVSYTNSFGWQRYTELPDYLPSWEYAEYFNMAMRNMDKNEAYSPEDIQKYKDGSDPDNYPNVNHLKWVLDSGSGFQQQHNLSIRGGNARQNYNLALGYRDQDGMTAKTNNQRLTALFNYQALLYRGLTLDLNLNAYANNYKEPGPGINGIIGYSTREHPNTPGLMSNGYYGHQDNYAPEAYINSESFYKSKSRNFAGQLQLRWETPINGLSIRGKVGATYNSYTSEQFSAKVKVDENYTREPNDLSKSASNNTYTTAEAIAQYQRSFGRNSINVLGGTSYESNHWESLNGYRKSFPNNFLYELSAGDASTATNGSGSSEWTLVSFFGRVNYSFADRYLLEANVRYDGSSRFARGNRWGFFPSVSGGWRISEEAFWKESPINNVFNNLKVRASHGVLGNQNIGEYPYQQVYSLGRNAVLGQPGQYLQGAYIGSFNNPSISWEKTRITDIGVDFGLFNNRLTGTLDYFYKYTSDILAPVEYTSIMGRGVGQSNVGAVSNKGIEINLSYNGNIGRDFSFSISPNFTWVKNSVEKLADGKTEDINNGRFVGEPLGVIYGYRTDGLFVDQAEIDAACEQIIGKGSIKPGYVKYVDLSGPDGVPDGKVDSTHDRTILGSTIPKYYYGLNVTANYKGFDFSALFQGMGGHKRLIGSFMAFAFYNDGQIQRWQAEGCWTEENPNKWAEYPRIETLNMGNTNIQTSDYWVRDASFVRLKNLQLGYSLPRTLISKIGLTQLRVYFSGQNLVTWKKFYKGWDPENEISTGDAPYFYPLARIYSFGFNLKF